MSLTDSIQALEGLEPEAALAAVESLADDALAASLAGTLDEASTAALTSTLVALVNAGTGMAAQRLRLGELLGHLGDPRLHMPEDDDYWVRLELKSGDAFRIGRFAVTNTEFRAFVASGAYEDRSLWTEEGWAWLQGCDNPWPVLVKGDDVAHYLVPNQPVVGVTQHEATAYAKAHDARLPRWYERVFAVRGDEKRPYPWGSPFGEGHANTKEEVLGRPCAVGLYVSDATPEGVHDLAGNVAEWTDEKASEEYLLHPGSWDQPSLAAWAKALTTEAPSSRWAGLGFRLVRDA